LATGHGSATTTKGDLPRCKREAFATGSASPYDDLANMGQWAKKLRSY